MTQTVFAAPVRIVDGTGALLPIAGQVRSGATLAPLQNGLAEVPAPEEPTSLELISEEWFALPTVWSADGATMRAWPTGRLHGKATAIEGTPRPSVITAYIEAPPDPMPRSEIARGTRFDCPVDDGGGFVCVLPAGTHDLSFRAKGLTPHYRWRVEVPRAKAFDLGSMRWRPGASLVVWLDRETARQVKGKATAHLTSMVTGVPSETAARLSVPAGEAAFDVRGYAQIAPLAAGTYALEVSAPGFAKTRLAPLEIDEGSETVLRKPLTLEPPLAITLSIQPVTDAEGRPWAVTLSRTADPGSPLSGESRQLTADAMGVVVLDGQSPGRFHVSIRDSAGNRVLAQDLDVRSGGDSVTTLKIEQHIVHGTVVSDEKPLRARLIFGTSDGAERVTITSNEEGDFRGLLPRVGWWPVQIVNETEAIDVVQHVEVLEDQALTLEVFGGVIRGVVLDDASEPVSKATVTAFTGSPLPQRATTNERGEFRLRGVSGSVRLRARLSRTGEESPSVSVQTSPEGETSGVVLRLVPRREVLGRVTSTGQPVVGASVSITPGGGGVVQRVTTNVVGEFRARLSKSESVATFIVAAAGRTLAASARPLSGDIIELDLPRAGGELQVALPEKSGRFWIARDGATLGTQELFEWAEAHGGVFLRPDSTLWIPALAPGTYRVCSNTPTGDVCRDAFVPPNAKTMVDLRQ